ncbi:hypothetical protein A3UG_18385 [Enterobacter cloacae subsp. dissolvens SDM]|nr:hypothetical protein A3UG_18385 [Enterobacter cloacae subsp. dissolvens SDM]
MVQRLMSLLNKNMNSLLEHPLTYIYGKRIIPVLQGITMLLAPINAPIQMCSKPAAIKAGVQRSLSF